MLLGEEISAIEEGPCRLRVSDMFCSPTAIGKFAPRRDTNACPQRPSTDPRSYFLTSRGLTDILS